MDTPDIGIRPPRYDLRSWDIVVFAEAAFFAVLSVAFPHSGSVSLMGKIVPRGYLSFLMALGIGMLAILAPFVDRKRAHPLLRFLRTFYPQAATAFFFTESIILSAMVFGGRSHDQLFMNLDQSLFGFQPAAVFGPSFYGTAWLNELMFGAYFFYYALLVFTPWIPYFTGKKLEAERYVFAFALFSGAFDVFYTLFRVQGPKYWLPELRSAWYENFEGGPFVAFFQNLFNGATLSGAAFPSSHVSEATLFTILAARIDKRLLYLYVPLSALIAMSTVYIYAHWAVDVLGGLICGLVLTPLALKAFKPAETLGTRLGQSFGQLALSPSGQGKRRAGDKLGR